MNKPHPYHTTGNVIAINRLFTPFHAIENKAGYVLKTRRSLIVSGVTHKCDFSCNVQTFWEAYNSSVTW
jgi:hypothetical protein